MTHISEGDLRAYLDHELDSETTAHVEAHVVDCGTCGALLADLHARHGRLSTLWADEDVVIPPLSLARVTVKTRPTVLVKESRSMKPQRRFQWRYSALATAAVLMIALMFPPVRAWASDLLGLFRVQKVTVLPVDLTQLNSGFDEDNQAMMSDMMSESVKSEPVGESQTVTSKDDASKAAGFSVRLPGSFSEAPTGITVNQGANIDLTLDVERLRALVATFERDDIQLPDSLDGAVLHIALPQGVTTAYGNCQPIERQDGPVTEQRVNPDCATLLQIPSPTVETPADLDMNQMGQLFLQLVGMDAERAAEFSRNLDWSSTLVLPIPDNEASYEDVSVDGVEGTIIRPRRSNASTYMLIWVKDGIIYGLNGTGSNSDAFAIANSMQ